MSVGAGEAAAVIILVLFAIYGVIMLVSIVLGILGIISMWKLYDKAGEPGWSAIVPIYSYLQMIKIATGSFRLAVVYLILCAVYVASTIVCAVISAVSNSLAEPSAAIWIVSLCAIFVTAALYIGLIAIVLYVCYMFTKSYGKSTAFCVLSIFFFPITLIIMGFDKSVKYVGPKGIPGGWSY